jgi:surfactin synthase thioesterase subunit
MTLHRPPCGEPWLVELHVEPEARLDLVVVPHALAGPAAFRSWARLVPPDIALVAACLPGRERRISEPPATRLEVIADEVFAAVAGRLRRPVVLFGHSLGALIAFEVARRLEAVDAPVLLLAASGCGPPHQDHPLPGAVGPDAPDDELLASLASLGGTPNLAREPQLVASLLDACRADMRVTAGYRYHDAFPPLRCGISAMIGTDDELFDAASVEAWRRHTLGTFTFRPFPGGHFFLDACGVAVVEAILEDLAACAPR